MTTLPGDKEYEAWLQLPMVNCTRPTYGNRHCKARDVGIFELTTGSDNQHKTGPGPSVAARLLLCRRSWPGLFRCDIPARINIQD